MSFMVCLSWLLSIILYRILLVNDIDILNMAKCELWENNSHLKIQSIILHALFKRFSLQIYQNNEGKKNPKKTFYEIVNLYKLSSINEIYIYIYITY